MTREACSMLGPETAAPARRFAAKHRGRGSLWALLGFAWIVSPPAEPAHAALTVFTVDTTAQRDSADDLPANCTLGDAIVAANNDAPEDGCTDAALGTGGPFEIVLPAGSGPYLLSVAGSRGMHGDNGLPIVTSKITILGNGNAIERNAGLGCPDPLHDDFRILEVADSGELELEALVLRNGCAAGGGGIRNAGTLTLVDSVLSDSTAFDGNGGGIENEAATVHVVRSSMSDNQASGMGGGIYNSGDALLTLTQSSVSRNSADTGGGVENFIGSTTLWNSTVSGNAASVGGGVENSGGGVITLISSTVAANQATREGEGIVNRNGRLIFANTVLRDPCLFLRSPGDPDAGHNIERRDTCGLVDLSSMPNTRPLLGPLRDNGGPTQTHALLQGSPAIDRGDDAACAGQGVNGVDQRGVERPDGDAAGGGRCDIGAVEFVDCDGNGVDDGTEIAEDSALDQEGNMILDACEDQPPIANAGPDQSVECTSFEGTEITLDGTGSSDPDSDALAFAWTGSFGTATGPTPSVTLPLGTEVVILSVEDGSTNAALDAVEVTIRDTTPPTVQASLERIRKPGIWRRFRVRFACTDACDADPLVTASVDGLSVENGDVLKLRGFGRHVALAVLTVSCEDASGNAATAQAEARLRPGKVGGADKADRGRAASFLLDLFTKLKTFIAFSIRAWFGR